MLGQLTDFSSLHKQNLSSMGVWSHGLKFFSILVLVLTLGRMFHRLYKTHSYLYQWRDGQQLRDDWIMYLQVLVRLIKIPRYKALLDRLLRQASLDSDWGADEFIAYQMIVGAFTFVFSFVCLTLMAESSPLWSFVIVLLVLGLQLFRLYERGRKRLVQISKDLPFFIDYLALAMSAGLGFNQSLEKVIANIGGGPLADEFILIQKSLNLGVTRERALYEFKDRINTAQASQFIETLVQAIEQGAGVADTLRSIASGLNTKRFQIAEEEAGKISVKMLIPVIIFILPALMLVLLGPIILELAVN